MDASEVFRSNLDLIDRIARAVAVRRRLPAGELEDFVATARLALLDDDYAVLRRYEGRSSLAGFLAVVFDHLISDQRDHALGRWHPSRTAERMGPAGVLLETMIRRDNRTFGEALTAVHRLDPSITPADAEAMLDRLPQRVPRLRAVDVDDLGAIRVEAPERGDAHTVAREEWSLAARIGDIVRRTLGTFAIEDRTIIRMHFASKLTLAEIARMLRLPQRPLYRRLETRLAELRSAIECAGLDSKSITSLIGSAIVEIDFGLQNEERPHDRPSLKEEGAAAGDEW